MRIGSVALRYLFIFLVVAFGGPGSSIAQNQNVVIYWHENGLVEQEAKTLKRKLSKLGIRADVVQHGDPRAPDAVYIRPDAAVEAVRTVLSTLSYTPSYIFPVDYPNDEVGVDSEYSISVGLRSTFRYYENNPAEVPHRVTPASLAYLAEAGISQSEFVRRLKHVAPGR